MNIKNAYTGVWLLFSFLPRQSALLIQDLSSISSASSHGSLVNYDVSVSLRERSSTFRLRISKGLNLCRLSSSRVEVGCGKSNRRLVGGSLSLVLEALDKGLKAPFELVVEIFIILLKVLPSHLVRAWWLDSRQDNLLSRTQLVQGVDCFVRFYFFEDEGVLLRQDKCL